MTVVIDTAAMFAVVDRRDRNHRRAVATARVLAAEPAVVTNYIASEALSLMARRNGMEAARELQRGIIAVSGTLWTTPLEHAAAVEAFLDSGRGLSFVDCATMATMRSRGLARIFTFDEDFAQAGFEVVPA